MANRWGPGRGGGGRGAAARSPGWYSDPDQPGHWRWWDGDSWTEHEAGQAGPEHAGPEHAGPEHAGPERGGPELGGPGPRPGPTERSTVEDGPDGPGPAAAGPAAAGPMAAGPVAAGPGPDKPGPELGPGRRSPGVTGRRSGGGTGSGGATVFARRWAALAGAVVVLVIVLAVVLRGHPPALYWQGEPFADGSQVLVQAESSMRAVASADEGVVSAQSRCYFSLPTKAAHDVAPYLRCGPVLLPWSSDSAAWLSYPLSATAPSTRGVNLSVQTTPAPEATVALARGEVLRRPDGTGAPQGDAGLAVPAVPRQPPDWAATLEAPPAGLRPAPVADFVGDWGRSYRLVAYGRLGFVSSRLDPAALRVADDPAGSAYRTGPAPAAGATSVRPLAKLLLPPKGQVFIVAELAVNPGEAGGAVPASSGGSATVDQPSFAVQAGGVTATVPGTARSSDDLTVVASVPALGAAGGAAVVITDKGLVQELRLSTGEAASGPSVLARAGTDEPLSVTGEVDGVSVHVSDASLVWFAGSDGGTTPPDDDEAYLQVLATASPLGLSFLPASDFTLQLPGGQVAQAQALPDANRQDIVMGFLVPASFSVGTVVVSAGGRSFGVPVHFP